MDIHYELLDHTYLVVMDDGNDYASIYDGIEVPYKLHQLQRKGTSSNRS